MQVAYTPIVLPLFPVKFVCSEMNDLLSKFIFNVTRIGKREQVDHKRQAADFTNQHCMVLIVSDNRLDHYFQFVKNMLLYGLLT